jgi:hypothetical protein
MRRLAPRMRSRDRVRAHGLRRRDRPPCPRPTNRRAQSGARLELVNRRCAASREWVARPVGRHQQDEADDEVAPVGTGVFAQPAHDAGDDSRDTATVESVAGRGRCATTSVSFARRGGAPRPPACEQRSTRLPFRCGPPRAGIRLSSWTRRFQVVPERPGGSSTPLHLRAHQMGCAAPTAGSRSKWRSPLTCMRSSSSTKPSFLRRLRVR